MTFHHLSRERFGQSLKAFTSHYSETYGLDDGENFEQFRRDISAALHEDLTPGYLWEAVEAQVNLDRIDNGTHEDLHVNRAGTIDNREELEDAYTDHLNVAVQCMTSQAYGVPAYRTPVAA